jgi:co-chaperonin GroES (HSP10)
MKIYPLGDKILLKLESAKIGNMATDSMKTGVEWGEVLACGPDVSPLIKPGDKIFVKAWSIDTIDYEGKHYVFTSEKLKGVCALVK